MLHVNLVERPPQDVRHFGNELMAKLKDEDVEVIREIFRTPLTGSYNWDYESANAKIRRLYELGKRFNWNAEFDVDWAQLFPRSQSPTDPALNAFAGHPKYEALSEAEKMEFAWRGHAQTLSQFLHGEQGALMVASQLVTCAPTHDPKLYAASQTFDEARHVEVFHKYLRTRCQMVYPINPNLKALLDKVLTDERWDLKFIGMQVLIEGLALAAFQSMRQTTRDPLLRDIIELVMRDEGRHVAFGVNYLEDWVRALPEAEIEDRAQFAYEACVIMRERLFSTVVAEEFGFTQEEARAVTVESESGQAFREFLFERMIPNLKRVGLLTESVRPKFEALGVLKYEGLPHDGQIDWAQLERPLARANLNA
ncbi:MAG TPA: ferritin-like domain-containing protein [Caulobacteraceae bacterium]|nr:ferritin-like domain-containing protein [Caulobacteraceae bacterium]